MMLGAMAQAQQFQFFDEQQIVKISNDGKTVVSTNGEGGVVIYNSETDTYSIYEADYDTFSPYYSVGFGNILSNNGIMVGNYDDSKPAIWDGQEWKNLPLGEGDGETGHLNSADAITADGKRICGGIARAKFSIDAEDIMMVPVIWDQNEDGNFGDYKVLPHPSLDFTGRVPQYITARGMSDDGKTIVGQIVDYSGSYPLPIVYREDEKGEWSYEIIGSDLVYNAEAVFPEMPAEPKAPKATNYMNDAEQAAYDAAYAEYQQQVDDYFSGLIDDYPDAPDPADFINDPTQYNADYAKYQEEQEAYMVACDEFDFIFYDPEMVYGCAYNFNSMFVTRDGKYAVSMYMGEDPDSTSEDFWDIPYFYKLVRFNLQDNSYEISEEKDGLPTGMLDDGTVVYASPVLDYTRTTSLIPVGGTTSVSLYDYVTAKNADAAKVLEENLTFTKVAYDENWEPVPGETGIFTGSAVTTGDGKAFAGWLYNGFIDDPSWEFRSYLFSWDSTDGIKAVQNENAKVTAVTVTDLNGKVIYSGTDTVSARKAMNFGVNILTTTMSDGSQKSIKVTRN